MAVMSKVVVRGWRRGVLVCAFPAALLCAAGAVAAGFNERGNIVIADQFNNRVIEIDPHTLAILWQFGNGSDKPGRHSVVGTNDAEADQLNNTNSAELLQNGHVLIADENNNRVIEVTTAKQLVRQFTARGTVSGAAFASRLHNCNTLFGDQ